jgi:hypothetical protein
VLTWVSGRIGTAEESTFGLEIATRTRGKLRRMGLHRGADMYIRTGWRGARTAIWMTLEGQLERRKLELAGRLASGLLDLTIHYTVLVNKICSDFDSGAV